MAGDLNLEAGLLALFARAAEAMAQAVTEGPFAEAQENVPVLTEALKNTGKVSGPVIEGTTATVVMSWGEPGQPTGEYAIKEHEDLTLSHPNGGEAKWAERAQLAAAATFAQQIAAKME